MLDRRDLKVIFMGTPEFAGTNLKALIDAGFDVRLVLCQPDKPVGRKHILTAPPVKVMAQENNIEVYQPDTLRNEEALAKLSSYEELDQYVSWIEDNEPCLFDIPLPENSLLTPKIKFETQKIRPELDKEIVSQIEEILQK